MFFTAISKGEIKKGKEGAQFHGPVQSLQDEGDCQKDSLSCLWELGNVLNKQQA
jgi:hypothetical protein